MQVEEFIKWYGPNFFTLLRDDYLIPAFQKMALTYSVSTSRFYDTVHDHEYLFRTDDNENFDIERWQKDWYDYVRAEGVYRSYHRLKAIISRLSVTDEKQINASGEQAFFAPKVFDVNMQEAVISSYNTISTFLGVAKISRIAPANLTNRVMFDREGENSKKVELVLEYYAPNMGYALPLSSLERSKFTFVECAILSCIYLTFYRQAIPTLNRPIETDSHRKRARGRLKKAIALIYDPKFYINLCRTALDVIADSLVCREIDVRQRCLTDFEWVSGDEIETLTSNKHMKKPYKVNLLSVAESYYLCGKVFPVVELILMGVIPDSCATFFDDKHFCDIDKIDLLHSHGDAEVFNFRESVIASEILDADTKKRIQEKGVIKVPVPIYWLAREIAVIIKAYITAVQRSVVDLLRSLPEFKEFDEKLIIKYSENKY